MQKRTMLFFLLVFCTSFMWAQEAIETNESKEEKKKTEKPAKGKAQKEQPAKEEKENPRASGLAIPKNMFEFGLNGGMSFLGGDVTPKPSYGVGLHWRKALDYVFSLRGDVLYADLKGMNPTNNVEREFQTQWFSSTLYGVMSLNSLRWDKSVRNTNVYIMGGAGVNSFEANSFNTDDNLRVFDSLGHKFAPHMGLGAGLAFRLSNRINIALENQAQMVFGNRADRIDNIQPTSTKSIFRDVVSFTNLSINFNIGSSSKKTEPLYWINPMDGVMNSIDDKINQRTTGLIKDEDGDGVIDAIDQDPNTPAGAMVDTKGRTLDSDRDGVPDHIDKEPFYMPQANEKVDEQGVVVNPQPGGPGRPGAGGVTEERVKELIDQALQNYQIADNRSSAAEWFLPMLHFPSSSSQIKYSDFGNLAGVGRMLKANPGIRLVVTGYTDSTGSESVNNQLSFERAKNVIEHLVANHGLARGRFVLQWKGSADNLVPTSSSYMNRRVEFRIAGPGDVESDPPAPKEGGY